MNLGGMSLSGLEWSPLAAKMLTAAVTKLAAKAAHSFLFRWRVTRDIRRSVSFEFPEPTFRAWLNRLDVTALSKPIEEGGAVLASSLDRALATQASWNNDHERHSKALKLVEATYVSMAKLAGEPHATMLRDQWARARHETLLAQLHDLVGLAPHFSHDDLAISLRASSRARRAVRLDSFGLGYADLAENFERLSDEVPTIPGGALRVIVGPFGSGKSEIAEQWFGEKVSEYARCASTPRPVWIHASELATQTLSSIVARTVPSSTVAQSGVAFVVDGLDEVEGFVAARIADDCRVFVASSPQSVGVLTCRPGVLPTSDDQVSADGLTSEHAMQLVEAVSGTSSTIWSWNPMLVDAIRRPFFAIAAGLMIAEGVTPVGQAELISRLVERALARQTSASIAVTSADLYALLVKLGLNTVRTGNRSDGLTFQERQQLRLTRLVHFRSEGRIEFSLPIFQQWFAARAVLDDPRLVDEAIFSPQTFDQWRWSLAIAALAATPSQLDDILERCFRADPAAGGWLLARVSDGHRGFRSENLAIDGLSAPVRLLRATRTIIDSMGPLSPLIYPVRDTDSFITLGVRVENNRVSTGWCSDSTTEDRVLALPAEVHPFAGGTQQWIPDRWGSVAEGDEWPWILSRERVSGSALKLLETHPKMGPEGGIWHIETRYRIARLVADDRTVCFTPLNAKKTLGAARRLLDLASEPEQSIFMLSGKRVSGAGISDLVNWIESTGIEEIKRPLPAPDFPAEKSSSSWVWDVYSDKQLQRFYSEAYGNACQAYDEAADSVFSKFAWSMKSPPGEELGVLLELSFSDTGLGRTRTPVYEGAMVPTRLFGDAANMAGGDIEISSNGRAAVRLASAGDFGDSWPVRFSRMRLEEVGADVSNNPFASHRGWWSSIADHTQDSRPASLLAAGWLFSDLKQLDLASGTFPQFER
jgi:hypothetical protein